MKNIIRWVIILQITFAFDFFLAMIQHQLPPKTMMAFVLGVFIIVTMGVSVMVLIAVIGRNLDELTKPKIL